jgi:hypothetical protein
LVYIKKNDENFCPQPCSGGGGVFTCQVACRGGSAKKKTMNSIQSDS